MKTAKPKRPFLAYKFRLYPNADQTRQLESQIETLRNVYNAALAWWKDAYAAEKLGQKIIPRKPKVGGGESKVGLLATLYPIISSIRNLHVANQKAGEPGPHWLAQVGSVPMRDTIKRVQVAFDNFYRRCKEGAKKKGYPRFKAYGRLNSIPYDNYASGCVLRGADGKTVHGDCIAARSGYRLDVFGAGRIKARVHRDIVGKIKTACVKREPDGKWYVVLMCEQEAKIITPKEGPAVGIDVGLEHFLTTSEGDHEANPRHQKQILRRLRVENRSMHRKIESAKKQRRKLRESRNYQKSKLRVAKLHVKVKNQRKDHAYQVAHRLVNRYSTICLESLNVQGMVRNRKLSRAISDAGWSGFGLVLKQVAAKHGCSVVEVDPRGTSQTCPRCQRVAKKELKERIHDCPCGYKTHRDHAAAQVILQRGAPGKGAVLAPAQHNVGPLPVEQSAGKAKRAGRNPHQPTSLCDQPDAVKTPGPARTPKAKARQPVVSTAKANTRSKKPLRTHPLETGRTSGE